ncbi:MAG: hypothetical protein JO370_08390 [Paucibacter sp.]|nr:hypothetical protein [Roseateles sp.]
MKARTLTLVLALLCGASAQALEPLSDKAMSSVRGGDGVSFDLSGFSMSGDARLTYTAPNGSSAYIEKFTASRSDSTQQFTDPFLLDIVAGASGLADVVKLNFPGNGTGEQRWQFAYDWGVNSDGIAFQGGSVVAKDMVFTGGGLQVSTPQVNDGVAFGAALKLDIGQLSFQPRGRTDTSEQMVMTGVHVGGVDANGNFNGTPWVISDVASQPAVINALTDETGERLHIGLSWPDARYGSGQASAGGVVIDNITFNSPNQAPVDLGSSRIGSMQLQYLDIKFRH